MTVSPSILFWLDLSADLITALVAFSLLFLASGTGLRQRTNQAFGLFVASAAATSSGFALARVTLWIGFGDPLAWSELATIGFYFIGPTLLAFTLVCIGSKATLYQVVVLAGAIAGFALIPALLNHQIISNVRLGQAGHLNLELTKTGYIAAAGPLLFQALTLIIYWQHRRQLGSLAVPLGTAFLMLSGVLGFLLRAFLPAVSLSFAVGILLMGYDVMSRQLLNPLRALTEHLEAVVAQRNHELQHGKDTLQHLKEVQRRVSQINQEIARISDPTAIVTRLTALIHAYLGYHHVYIYQADKTGQYLVASAAAGTTARSVMRRGHRLEIGAHSLAGRAAEEHSSQIAQARGEDAVYFEDTALPGARAEIALPLLIGDQLLGVLDLQSIHFEAFSDQDVLLLTSLADHAAVTLDNARWRQEIRVALAESDKLQRQYLQQAWGAVKDRSESLPAYIYTDGVGVRKTSPTTVWTPEISRAVTRDEVLVNHKENDSSSIVLPIALRGQIIGALQVHHKTGRSWQPEDIATLTEVTERLGLALETARLSQENRRRAVREQLISEITARMHETLDVDTVLHTAAREMGKALGLHDVTIRLDMDENGTT